MKSERIELRQVDRRQLLQREAAVKLVERIGRSLDAGVQEVTRIRTLAVVRKFRVAAIEREIRSGGGNVIGKQPRTGAGEAVEIEDVWLRPVGDSAHGMGEFVQRDADQQVWINVGREGGASVIR